MMGETVTILRATDTTDGYGDTAKSWANPTRTDVTGCAVAWGPTAELFDGRDAVKVDVIVYVPHTEVDVTATDRLEVRGNVYEIVGQPQFWRSPYNGSSEGTVLRANVVNG